jgi:hypothetical protein
LCKCAAFRVTALRLSTHHIQHVHYDMYLPFGNRSSVFFPLLLRISPFSMCCPSHAAIEEYHTTTDPSCHLTYLLCRSRIEAIAFSRSSADQYKLCSSRTSGIQYLSPASPGLLLPSPFPRGPVSMFPPAFPSHRPLPSATSLLAKLPEQSQRSRQRQEQVIQVQAEKIGRGGEAQVLR